jgi:arabinogalactan endo-1,4-beta-galactosidase
VVLGAGLLCMAAGPLQSSEPRRLPLEVGVDANYVLAMEKDGATWRWGGQPTDLFAGMAARGVTRFRVRLWTGNEGPHGRDYATEIVKRATAAGMEPYLVVFLSDDWADMMKQPVPAAWKDLSFEQRLAAVRSYSRDTVAHFRRAGLRSHLYEIGNEIDYGICGEYPGKGTKRSPEALSRRVWPRAARLILASQAGVAEADPEATFMLHVAHWWDAEFCVAFFSFMREQGVRIDYAGLSYFPSSNIGGSLELPRFGTTVSRVARAVGAPVVVPETAYPSTREFTGQFSRWKHEVLGYPLTPAGQRRWIADTFAFCDAHPDIHSVYYWSPEWHGEGMWKGFALFDPEGDAKPAWEAFAASAWKGRAPLDPVYLEVRADELFVVPVVEATDGMVALVRKLREQAGGVTVDHIERLSETELVVGGYAVRLRASLQQNLDLELTGAAVGLPLAGGEAGRSSEAVAALAASLDPRRQRVVLIVREEVTPVVEAAVAALERKGIRVDLHPWPADKPLKFGACGEFDRP